MTQLPDDVYLAVFAYLDLDDIPKIRTASKKMLELTKEGSLWRRLLHIQIIKKRLPIPGLNGESPGDLRGFELEDAFRRAFELRLNWTSPNPLAKSFCTISSTTRKARVISLQFLKCPGCHWLLSLSAQGSQEAAGLRRLSLECWDYTTSPPTCIARKEFSRLLSMAVNDDATGRGIVAIQAPFITVYSLRPSPNDPDSGFIPYSIFPDKEDCVHVYSGSTLLTTHPDGRVLAWDMKCPTISWELTNSRFPRLEHGSAVLAGVFNGRCVIVVKSQVCEAYTLPTSNINESCVLEPIRQFSWPWKVDTVVMSQAAVIEPRSLNDHHHHNPIIILLRFGSIYPWPINLLHQFEISLNETFIEDETIHEGNTPYQFPPVLRQTVASPIRLFSQTDMSIGPYGTAIWLDSHTEDYFGQPNQGQRLAARLTSASQDNEEADMGQDALDQVATTMAASVMRYNEFDSWVKLAMDEEEGVLALGHRDGDITLLSYI